MALRVYKEETGASWPTWPSHVVSYPPRSTRPVRSGNTSSGNSWIVDHLASKVSTSASRFESELAQRRRAHFGCGAARRGLRRTGRQRAERGRRHSAIIVLASNRALALLSRVIAARKPTPIQSEK